ncbi:MAG TPA: DUF805 domain-containing protein, partial [Dongiaceae bacterium]|nr:DUF805 domain-containing protein [Dongiaceae bacterium]
GRSSRAEWWRVHIFCAVLAVMFEHAMMSQLAPRNGIMQPVSMLWPLATLALAWVSFAGVVRRFHDRGKSGWWALLYFMPVIGWLWILIECGFLPGKPNVAYTFSPAPAPVPAPAAPSPREAARARMQSVPRASTVQRRERQAWDGKRALKLADVAVRVAIAAVAAFMLYKFALDPDAQIFTDLTSTLSK